MSSREPEDQNKGHVGECKNVNLTSSSHIMFIITVHYLYLPILRSQATVKTFENFLENPMIPLFCIKKPINPYCHFHLIGQGQPKVMIYTNYDGWISRCYIRNFIEINSPVPEQMLFMIFTIYGHGGHLGHVT